MFLSFFNLLWQFPVKTYGWILIRIRQIIRILTEPDRKHFSYFSMRNPFQLYISMRSRCVGLIMQYCQKWATWINKNKMNEISKLLNWFIGWSPVKLRSDLNKFCITFRQRCGAVSKVQYLVYGTSILVFEIFVSHFLKKKTYGI